MRLREVGILFLYVKSYSLDLKILDDFETKMENKKQPPTSLRASETHRDQPVTVIQRPTPTLPPFFLSPFYFTL